MFFKNYPINCEHAHTRTPTYYSISHYCKEFCVYSGWVPHIRQSMYDKVTLCTLWQKRQNRPLTTLWTLSCQRNMARYSNTSDQINIRLKITFLMHPIDLSVMKLTLWLNLHTQMFITGSHLLRQREACWCSVLCRSVRTLITCPFTQQLQISHPPWPRAWSEPRVQGGWRAQPEGRNGYDWQGDRMEHIYSYTGNSSPLIQYNLIY